MKRVSSVMPGVLYSVDMSVVSAGYWPALMVAPSSGSSMRVA